MSNYRSNDGLDASSTTDAQGSRGSSGNDTNRTTDGLDTSGTSDAYNDRSSGGYSDSRTTDGLDTSNTSDTYSSGGNASRTTDGLDPSGTTDASSNTTRSAGGHRSDTQETSEHTSGGLGEDDTYGDETETGGNDTGYDHNYGMGSGRTITQEKGGPLPTEPGRVDIHRQAGDYDERPGESKADLDTTEEDNTSNAKDDSTTGKLMAKAGGLLGNENLREKGEEKRRVAGAGSGSNGY